MNRQLLVKIHLYFSAFFAPFLLLMAVTGTFYLLGYKGSVEKEKITSVLVTHAKLNEDSIRSYLKEIDPEYTFEYLKTSSGLIMTRPTTRMNYEFKQSGDQYTIYRVKPNFLKSIIEVHKGHGPKILKGLQTILGVSLMIILVSGMLIAFATKRDQKPTLILMSAGGFVLLVLFYFF